jgi:NADH:ubiquinone oxidoreductase subunit 2 (subunit N)
MFLLFLLPKKLFLVETFQRSLTRLVLLAIRGLPPFSIFWLKINIVAFYIERFLLLTVVIVIVSIFSLLTYYRGYHLSAGVSGQRQAGKFKFLPFFLIIL